MGTVKASVALAMGLAASGISACTTSDAPTAASAILAHAYSATIRTGSATTKLTFSQTGMGASNDFTESGTGAIDFRHHASEAEVALWSGGTLDVEQVGGTYYELPASQGAPATPPGKPWIAVPFNPVASHGGVAAAPTVLFDPDVAITTSSALSFLTAPVQSVRSMGSQVVDGFTTSEYQVTLNDSITAAPIHSPKAASPVRSLAPWQLPVLHVWIDTAGRVRQLQVTSRGAIESTSAAETGRTTVKPKPYGSSTATIEFVEFGTSVYITPPPASQVTNESTMPLTYGSSSVTNGTGVQQIPFSNASGDADAQSNLRNALTNAMTIYANSQNFGTITQSQLRQADPALDWLAEGIAPTAPDQIAWMVLGRQYSSWISLATMAVDDNCFYIWTSAGSPTTYGASTAPCVLPETEMVDTTGFPSP